MANLEQKKKADALKALHLGKEPLVLANVWDVASARVIEEAGFPALATTSAGIAFAQGFPDGEKISAGQMLQAGAQIARAVRVPVTADVEAGYGDRPEDAARTPRGVIEAGAVGMNFEDSTGDSYHPLTELPLQLERIRAIREPAQQLDIPLVDRKTFQITKCPKTCTSSKCLLLNLSVTLPNCVIGFSTESGK